MICVLFHRFQVSSLVSVFFFFKVSYLWENESATAVWGAFKLLFKQKESIYFLGYSGSLTKMVLIIYIYMLCNDILSCMNTFIVICVKNTSSNFKMFGETFFVCPSNMKLPWINKSLRLFFHLLLLSKSKNFLIWINLGSIISNVSLQYVVRLSKRKPLYAQSL